jgi:hypothetical protein
VETVLREALRARSLRVAGETLRAAHSRTLLAYDSSGRCAFLESGRTCAVHRRLGHAALPVSCRLFPRVCLLTPQGAFVTLSHYCPTAAALLFLDDPAPRIVTNAPAFPEAEPYEGLDARQAPPPLLRPGVWLGWDGHQRWQRHVIDVLGRDGPPEEALALLAAQAERARGWTIDHGPFADYLEAALAGPSGPRPPSPPPDDLYDEVVSAIPAPLRPTRAAAVPDVSCEAYQRPVRRYLAARAFGSWIALQGSGLRTSVRALQAAAALVRREAALACAEAGRALDGALLKEAFRRADLSLVHLASPEHLAAAFSRCENRPGEA